MRLAKSLISENNDCDALTTDARESIVRSFYVLCVSVFIKQHILLHVSGSLASITYLLQ